MHIGMILSTPLPPSEGIGFYCWNLAHFLIRQGHRVTLITRGGSGHHGMAEVDGISIYYPSFIPVYPYHVHLHSLFVNKVVYDLDPQVDLWHIHSPLVRVPKTKRPILVTVHSPMMAATKRMREKSFYHLLIRLQTPVSIQLEKELFSKADKIIAVARSIVQDIAAYGIPESRIEIGWNGVDTSIFQPTARTVLNQSHPYLLTVGRLAPGKGLEDLLECAARVLPEFPTVQFWIAGAGPLKDELQSKINQRNLADRVILLGQISDRLKMIRLYQNSYAYIHPSHYEGMPTVLLEAMACGKAVISTAISGALDIIRPAENGLLIPPCQPEVLAQEVLRLLRSPSLACKLGTAGSATIRSRFSWEVISANYRNQYEKLLQGVSP